LNNWEPEEPEIHSLICYYPFNGNANDESGNGHNGVVHGAVLAADRFGNENSAYDFDGTDDGITIPISKYFQEKFTISFWIKTNGKTGEQPILEHRSSYPYVGWDCRIAGDKYPLHAHLTIVGDREDGINTTGIISNDDWYNILFVFNKNEAKSWVDGHLVSHISFPDFTFAEANAELYIGFSNLWGDRYYKGKIDDIRIYNRVLCQSEIDTLFYEGEWSTFIQEEYIYIPKDYALNQNYPNPFNPITTIQYAIPEKSHVTLTIYNIAGQALEVLENQSKEPGYYSVKWDASKVGSGIYLYRVQAGQFTDVKKCILLK
ncbi:MAG: T9SS type A sorting domain-containing protein, partial [Chloroflexi bacterium]|nr:T9SS type A sorting domain-containing protein [Chloroflexota bacterium]